MAKAKRATKKTAAKVGNGVKGRLAALIAGASKAALGKVEAKPAPKAVAKRDPRIPKVGTVLTREVDGTKHNVKVTADGFDYKGKTYRSLSQIALAITKTSWNGYLFFGLGAARG